MENFLEDETKCKKMMMLIGTMFFNIFHERTIDSPFIFSCSKVSPFISFLTAFDGWTRDTSIGIQVITNVKQRSMASQKQAWAMQQKDAAKIIPNSALNNFL